MRPWSAQKETSEENDVSPQVLRASTRCGSISAKNSQPEGFMRGDPRMFKRIAIASFLAVTVLTTGCAAKKEAPPPAASDDSARRAEDAAKRAETAAEKSEVIFNKSLQK
jgi:hypothetical protein